MHVSYFFCYVGVEMSVHAVRDRARHTFSVGRGSWQETVNDLDGHRFDNEVLLCCLREARSAFSGCAHTHTGSW